ncbi:hypothetical protein AB0L82_35825 [Nocardia sp. NPDC052001]|uniref:hypothetical protein n=1 Tax=Nocardia sp. NPDC052001 TaxID=3154853 RepID=UPI0034380A3A
MTTRSRQAAALAQVLGDRIGRPVRHSYDGPRTERYSGGWRLEWTDGPTIGTMRALAREYAARFPDLPPVENIRFDRAHTDQAEATALLLWLDTDPNSAFDTIPGLWLEQSFAATEDPDRAPEVWQRRGHTLYAMIREAYTAKSSSSGHTIVVTALAERIRASGWDQTLAWLDRQAEPHHEPHLRIVK